MSRLTHIRRPGAWRQIAVQAWGPPNDPTIYGALAIDATRAMALIARTRAESGEKVTLTHVG
ncbi:MAG: hypothetical protein AABZ30_02220 [Myxococcota bacterium]